MNVIICSDVYERRIHELRAAIELLEHEYNPKTNKCPFEYATSILKNQVWKCVESMMASKKAYTEEEWKRLMADRDSHASPEEDEEEKYWDAYFLLND